METEDPTKRKRPKKHLILFVLGLIIFLVTIIIITWRAFHKTTKQTGFQTNIVQIRSRNDRTLATSNS